MENSEGRTGWRISEKPSLGTRGGKKAWILECGKGSVVGRRRYGKVYCMLCSPMDSR